MIYLNNAVNQDTVYDAVNNFIDSDGNIIDSNFELTKVNGSYAAEMSNEEWRQILLLIKNDPDLMKLKIQYGQDVDPYLEKLGGTRMAFFVDPNVQPGCDKPDAVVVFRGTYGISEWIDDANGYYYPETDSQNEALAYVQRYGNHYANLIATGHSKGGNKAQYVTILSHYMLINMIL